MGIERINPDELHRPPGYHHVTIATDSASRCTGTEVVKVSAAFTSQRCSACGHVDPKSRESQAVFRCTTCPRPAEHADVNAAKTYWPQDLRSPPDREPAASAGAVTSTQEPAGNREDPFVPTPLGYRSMSGLQSPGFSRREDVKHCWSANAVGADRAAVSVHSQPVTMLHQKAAGAGELVGLLGQHAYGELFTG